MKRRIFFGSLILISIFTVMFIITSTLIGYSVEEKCKMAKEKYQGDCVEALILLLNDEENTYRARNYAIWALGQIGDKRALPVLNKYYTGNIPSKEPYDDNISQYELKKAINLARGGINITHLVR